MFETSGADIQSMEPIMNSDQSGSVKSVEVAVQILDVLADADRPLRVTEIARSLGMTKARISRHLQTLQSPGLVGRDANGTGYVFGRKLLHYARVAIYRSSVFEAAQPFLRHLRDVTGHTAIQTVPTPNGALVVAAVAHEMKPGVSIQVGTVLPFPQSPSARMVQYFDGNNLNSSIAGTGTFDASELKTKLAMFGVEYEDDGLGNGFGKIAAPIFESDGNLAATVGVILSSSLISPSPQPGLMEQIRSTAGLLQAHYADGAISPLMPTFRRAG